MNKSQFTITLAKSGQRVVTAAAGDYENRGFNKRSLGERISDASFDCNSSSSTSSKRMRHDESARVYESNKLTDDSRVGPNDLRVKLMQKEISRRAHLETAERKKRELYEKVSRAIKSAELEESRPRKVEEPRQIDNVRISNPIDERPQLLPMRQLDAPRTGHSFYEMPARSPGGVIRYSSGIPNPIDEHPQVAPLRQVYAPRTGRAFITDPVDSTRISVHLPTSSRAPLDSGRMITHLHSDRMVTQLPLGTRGMSRPRYLENQPQPYTESRMLVPPYPENQPQPVTLNGMSRPPYQENQPQPVTVSTLLNTIGLGKYAITFEAEEIDMLALRQMGDCDLKEMGIPMGPRKKILHAVEAHTERLIAQARSNYMQSLEFAR